MNSYLTLSTSSSGSCASFVSKENDRPLIDKKLFIHDTWAVERPASLQNRGLMHSRKSAKSKPSAIEGIQGSIIPASYRNPVLKVPEERGLYETFRLKENSWISDRKLQIVEGRTQRSHVVEKVARLVSITA